MTVFEGFADLERRGWGNESIASGYVNLFSSASDMAIPALIDGLEPGMRVLDLCCGQGNVSQALHAHGCRVVGADFSPTMLGHARKRFPDGEFVEADAQDLPFSDGEFDAVVSNLGLVHVPDQPRALNEARRILQKGGRFAMSAWCGPDASPVFQIFYGSVRAHGDPAVTLPEGPNFHQFADENTARALVSDAGFAFEKIEHVDCYWQLSRPEMVAEIFHQGAPRAGSLLTRQSDAHRNAVKVAITDQVRQRFADGESWRVPIPAAVVSAIAS